MKRRFRPGSVASAMLLGASLLPAPALALSIGDPAPATDAKMPGVDGREFALADVMGPRGTLVVFTGNQCPLANAWEGRIVSLGNLYAKSGIGVVAINPNDPGASPGDAFGAMVERARDRGYGFPYLVDSTSGVARAFGATATPEVFVFDASGRLAYHGAVDDEPENPHAVESPYLKDALDAVLEGKPAFPAQTKASGCSIEFRAGDGAKR